MKKTFTLAKGGTYVCPLCQFLYGFTLAEVLITLGIIGIVAALTIPGLVSKYRDKVIVTQVQKSYSEINEAFKRYMVEHECNNDLTCLFDTKKKTDVFNSEIAGLFKGAKICKNNEANDCRKFPNKPQKPQNDGTGKIRMGTFVPTIVLSDGVVMQVGRPANCPFESITYKTDKDGTYVTDADGNKIVTGSRTYNYCGTVRIDVNGSKPPNQECADMYYFYVYDDGSIGPVNCLTKILETGKLQYTVYDENAPLK